VCFAKHTLDLNQIGPEFFWVDLTQPAWRGWTQSAQPGHWPKPVTRLGTVGKRHAWIKFTRVPSHYYWVVAKAEKQREDTYLGLLEAKLAFEDDGDSLLRLSAFSGSPFVFLRLFSASKPSRLCLCFRPLDLRELFWIFLLVLGSPVSVSGFLPLLLVLFFRRSSFVVLPSLFRSSSMSSSNFSLFFQLLCCSASHFSSFLWIL